MIETLFTLQIQRQPFGGHVDGIYTHAHFEYFKNFFTVYQVFGGQVHCRVLVLLLVQLESHFKAFRPLQIASITSVIIEFTEC